MGKQAKKALKAAREAAAIEESAKAAMVEAAMVEAAKEEAAVKKRLRTRSRTWSTPGNKTCAAWAS